MRGKRQKTDTEQCLQNINFRQNPIKNHQIQKKRSHQKKSETLVNKGKESLFFHPGGIKKGAKTDEKTEQ